MTFIIQRFCILIDEALIILTKTTANILSLSTVVSAIEKTEIHYRSDGTASNEIDTLTPLDPDFLIAPAFKLLLLTGIVLQTSASVLVGRYSRRPEIPAVDLYIVNRLILVTEIGKLFLSGVVEQVTTNGQLMKSIQQNIIKRPGDTLKILVPALLYLLQNSLFYVALSNLTVPILQVTYQAKLVTTAIVSVLMLHRKYTIHQWICLVSLSLGVAIVVLAESGNNGSGPTDDGTQSLAKGLGAVMISCISSAFAGVYFEMLVKNVGSDSAAVENVGSKSEPVSVWMRNMELAFFTIAILLVQGSWSAKKLDTNGATLSFFHGFTTSTWILVALQAGGGLLVAAVIKYADNVLKGLATAVSVCVVTIVSAVLFRTPIGGQFSVGAIVILISVFFFLNPVHKEEASPISPSGKGDDTEALEPILHNCSRLVP